MKTKGLFKALAVPLAFVFLIWADRALGEEVITSFQSDVSITEDARVLVSETIEVFSEGRAIKRGIFRDFPTVYEDLQGRTVLVPFKVLSVTRDGGEEPWSLEKIDGGFRVRMGSSETFLDSGKHRYVLSYETGRQVGFFSDYDEFYWNATGNAWDFPIEKASCSVALPKGANIIETGVWTGRLGSKAKDAVIKKESPYSVTFTSKKVLHPGEGMTIALNWPKGAVVPPKDRSYFLLDNGASITFWSGALVEIGLLILGWLKVGKDPKKGVIIPRFTPPEGVSPAAARKILLCTFDDKSFSSQIVSLAVKGYLTIVEVKSLLSRKYHLKKTKGQDKKALEKDEERVYSVLLEPYSSLSLDKDNYSVIGGARDSLKDSLETEYGDLYSSNILYVIAPVAAMAATVSGATLLTGFDSLLEVLVKTGMVLFSVFFIAFCLWKMKKDWRKRRGLRTLVYLVLDLLWAFVGAFFFLIMMSIAPRALYTDSALLAMGILSAAPVVFIPLMRSRSKKGRALADQVEGFALYLKVAEEDRLDMLTPPEKTPELFERYLPYAIALDLEQAWGEKFSKALAPMDSKDSAYKPNWYDGPGPLYVGSMGSFAQNLGSSFRSAVASSGKAPGSSSVFSGGGGGGSSGGGGGGGGGGGW